MIKINSIVLVEIIFEFTKFVEEVLQPAGLASWEYCLEIDNFKEHDVALYSGKPAGWLDDLHSASKDQYKRTLPKDVDYTHVAFKILTEVYAFFTLPESSIPYASNGKVTKENILSMSINGR